MALQKKILAVRAMMRPLAADATFAVFLGIFVTIVVESLSLSGIITVKGAFIALALAWFVGLCATFFLDHIWPITGRDRIAFAAFLAVFLSLIAVLEFELHPVSQPAQAFASPDSQGPPMSTEAFALMWMEHLHPNAEACAHNPNGFNIVNNHASELKGDMVHIEGSAIMPCMEGNTADHIGGHFLSITRVPPDPQSVRAPAPQSPP